MSPIKPIGLAALVLLLSACDGTGDQDPPSITASVSPEANAAGWHNADTTVTFQCSDTSSEIASCSGPALVDTEGDNQTVTGTAVDSAGNTANVSLTVKLDKTSPELSGYRPADGDTSPYPEVNLTGKVDDKLSGIATVVCAGNGVSSEAVINKAIVGDDYVFACSLPLNPGPNIITVDGTDIAGNVTTSSLTINHTPPPKVTIESPTDGQLVTSSPISVTGTVDDASATLTVNDVPVAVTNGAFTTSVPLENGFNTITTVAQNAGGSGSASIRVLAIVGLQPTVRVLSPNHEFVLGKKFDAAVPLPVTVNGWVRDNRLLGIGQAPAVTVWFNNAPIGATVVKQTSGLCGSQNRCWTYSASMDFAAPEANLSIEVKATTGSLTTTRTRSGIVDFCYENNSSDSSGNPNACAACLFQRPGYYPQSRRCIQNADGCSNPVLPGRKDDPTRGTQGRTSTAFGQPEDANTPEGAFTVFGQPRPNQLPCNRHDECYHQWCPQVPTIPDEVVEKTACDVRFYQDMNAVCRKAYPEVVCPAGRIGLLNCPKWRLEKSACYSWALIYADAVGIDTIRYNFPGPYDGWPYAGFFTPCEGCPAVQ